MLDGSFAWSPPVLNVQFRSAVAAAAGQGIHPADPMTTPIAQARLDAQRWHAWWHGRLPEVRRVTEHAAPGPVGSVPLRFFYHRRHRRQPLAVYFHGGGFVLNSVTTHERLMRDLAVRADVAVCGVEYSLAPEHRHPVQLEEAVASLRWIIGHAADLGVDADRIALCGDSAGANLALAAACRLRDAGVAIRFLLLFYGMYACDFETPSHRAFGDGTFGLSSARMRWFWQQYLRDETDASNPTAAPLGADLRDLPPTLLIAAGLDCLRDDSIRLAARLEAAGVPHALSMYHDLPHGFAVLAPATAGADDAVAEAAEALARMRQRRGYGGWAGQHPQRQSVYRRVAATLSSLAAASEAQIPPPRPAGIPPLSALEVRRRPSGTCGAEDTGSVA